ncbi:hypothetical protein [Candidatus Proelusimicrobium volucris]|uniref:hypothetical protein n=1 Tax=Candidatus Proelusimicrobium volucris TaxID=3416225 RepID=UPI003D100D53
MADNIKFQEIVDIKSENVVIIKIMVNIGLLGQKMGKLLVVQAAVLLLLEHVKKKVVMTLMFW